MTSILLTVNGAEAQASVSGTLTSGMVGVPVTIEYDETWDGLTKNLVCRCSEWDLESGEQRTILNVGNTAVVAHEVMQAGKYLYLGLEGYSPDGNLVIPTTWARSEFQIQSGANADADPSTEPTLPVWEQLQTQIEQIRQDAVTSQEMTDILSGVQSAAQAAAIYAGRAEAAAKRAEDATGSSTTGGMTLEQINALDGMFRVCAFVKDDVSAEYNAFRAAFNLDGGGETPEQPEQPAKTLTSISATYSGGSVPVGTAVSALTGVVVTAHYSDGTSEAVTGYTLTGEIAEGENAVTVSYEGKTTTITVAGVTSGEVEPTDNRYAYTIDNPGTLCDTSGGLTGNGLYNTTGYIDVAADTLYMTVAVNVPISESKTPVITNAQWFNTEEFVSRTDAIVTVPAGGTKAVGRHKIPSGATKFRISVQTNASKFLLYKGTVSVDDAEF